jgi:NAD+ kinase
MKFAVVSLKNIQRIVDTLEMFGHDIDNNKPDFVITYGGDGTILHSERKYPGIPKITIRAGSVGFKCRYSIEELEDVLIKIDSGEYKLKEEIKLETNFQGRTYLSLNEVQLHNSSPIKAVRFSVYIQKQLELSENEILYDNVIGDGIIIATPFGSSAYYSSVGGEKFDKGIGIALNNPYSVNNSKILSKNKPVVIDEGFDYSINIKILQKDSKMPSDDGLLLFDNDNNMINAKGGDNIIVKKSKYTAKFVTI